MNPSGVPNMSPKPPWNNFVGVMIWRRIPFQNLDLIPNPDHMRDTAGRNRNNDLIVTRRTSLDSWIGM